MSLTSILLNHINLDGPIIREELGECWIFTGHCDKGGYGKVQGFLAHRLMWILLKTDPQELNVFHHCDNPPCLRIDHLYLGTQQDNVKDSMERGRFRSPKGEINGRSKLSEKQVLQIRALYDTKVNRNYIANYFDVSRALVDKIGQRENWRHV